MANIPDFSHNVSLKLSQVLNEIGVNEKIVTKRRRLGLLNESLLTLTQQLLDNNLRPYYFGSQIESTTTQALKSDTDILVADNNFNVIQDWRDWKPGTTNLLMLHDESVSPGYCLLQILRNDVPLPENIEKGPLNCRDRMGRILLKNTSLSNISGQETRRNGPAETLKGSSVIRDTDLVRAYYCHSWAVQASQWSGQLNERQWPSLDIREYCLNSGCFVVRVGGKSGENEEFEWRISTSLAERCLMFNLNITQIRCFVVMKMLMKTFITTQCPDSISSFMCKSVLLHCISNTGDIAWKENNLLICLTFCLSTLYNCVLNEYCPHFIILSNNLMARRFTPNIKQFLLETLYRVIISNGSALLEIGCDHFGYRVQNTFTGLVELSPYDMCTRISGNIVYNTASSIGANTFVFRLHLNSINHIPSLLQAFSMFITKVFYRYQRDQGVSKIACMTIAKQLSITLGSILASINISMRSNVTREALRWIQFGLDFDVSYGKLKLASVFYCSGEIEKTEMILKNVEERYDRNIVEAVCSCCQLIPRVLKKGEFKKLCYESSNEYTVIKHLTASCVMFLRSEINCCPYEVQHEMFRSTQQDLPYRNVYDDWMDMAIVDSLPYLYFLQYKTYMQLQRQEDKHNSLINIIKCILEEPNLGHRETALNLLGQCMEQENRTNDALNCYLISLKIRGRNNAAKFHICRLMYSLVGNNLQ